MRRSAACMAGVLFCGLAGAASAAVKPFPGTEFDTAGWSGAAIYDESGTHFRACYMVRSYDGFQAAFALDREGNLAVAVKNEDWALADDYRTTLRVQLDDRADAELGALPETENVLLVPLGAGDEVVEALRAGDSLILSGELGTFPIQLKGTSAALPMLSDCVADVPAEAGRPPLTDDEKKAVRALALYPADVRQAILDATLHPEVIAGLDKIAQGSRQAFRSLVGGLPRQSQALVWEVVRYPAMLDALLALGPSPAPQAVAGAIADQPPPAQKALQDLMAAEPGLIDEVHEIRLQAEGESNSFLSGYPLQVESAFRILLDHPEALAAMAAHPEIVAKIAETYGRDPQFVTKRLDQIALQADVEYQRAVQSWAQQLEANPEAAAQLAAAGRAYAEAQGTPQAAPAPPAEPAEELDPSADLTVQADAPTAAPAPGTTAGGYEAQPYPYYYGPPPGYDSYYPSTPQEDTGFYVNELGQMVVTGLVTYAFADWLFDDDDHWDDYPDFAGEMIVNVERNNIWIGGGDDRVRDWMDERRGELPDGWFDDDGDLRGRMRDYADAHESFDEWRKDNPGKGNFQDFVQENGDRFPDLKERSEKLRDGRGSGQQQLGKLLDKQQVTGRGAARDKLEGKGLSGNLSPSKSKPQLGANLKQGDGKAAVKLKKPKKEKVKSGKRRQDGWNGASRERKRKK